MLYTRIYSRPLGLLLLFLVILAITVPPLFFYKDRVPILNDYISSTPSGPKESSVPVPEPEVPAEPEPSKPIIDNIPWAAEGRALPTLPDFKKPPRWHVKQKTPLLIGFTRNWFILQQAVVSYIAAGWPPEDIFIVENTGTQLSNRRGLLNDQNPFYLDHKRLKEYYKVNVIETPVLLTFSQLQNFYLNFALLHNWDHYFWGHMDVVVFNDERYIDPVSGSYMNFYTRAVDTLRRLTDSSHPKFDPENRWALIFFAYDWLALTNVKAYLDIGGYDSQIAYYHSDCDFHERLRMHNYTLEETSVGTVFDVGHLMVSPTDPSILFREGAKRNDSSYARLLDWFEETNMKGRKGGGSDVRLSWQRMQQGGQGDPFFVDPEGFERAVRMTIGLGDNIYKEKWGYPDCNLIDQGLRLEHQWHPPPPPPPPQEENGKPEGKR